MIERPPGDDYDELDTLREEGHALPPPHGAPARLGGYRIVSELGRGAMGAVYEAISESGVRRAVKTLLPAGLGGNDPEDLARFRREAELGARLNHPHVVAVHEADLDGSPCFLVQDLLSGGSLRDRLNRHGPLPLDQALEVAIKLGGALAHAHAKGVLHRDLKPRNVMFDERGEPRLVDFGLSRLLGSSEQLTGTGMVLGTPAFMSPEQATGQRDVDERCDVYGLGGLLYAMLTGRPPFFGKGVAETLEAVRLRAPIPPSSVRADVTPAVEAVILRALAKKPEQRFATVADMVRALEAVRDGEDAPPRGTRVALLGFVLVAVLLLGVGGGWFLASRERGSAPESPTPELVVTPSDAPEAPTAARWQLEPGDTLYYLWTRALPGGPKVRISLGLLLELTVQRVEEDTLTLGGGVKRVRYWFDAPLMQRQRFDSGWPRDKRELEEVWAALSAPLGQPFELVLDTRGGGLARVRGLAKLREAIETAALERGIDLQATGVLDRNAAVRIYRDSLSEESFRESLHGLLSLPQASDATPRLGAAWFEEGRLRWAVRDGAGGAQRLQLVDVCFVRSLEDLSDVAERAGVFLGALASRNGIDAKDLGLGQALWLPPARSGSAFEVVEVTEHGLPVHLDRWGLSAEELDAGQRRVVVERAPPWARIEWGGAQAWVQGSGLKPVPGAELAVVTAERARVKSHWAGGDVLGHASRGKGFPVLELREKWVQIQFDDRQGWLPLQAVTVQKSP